MSDDTLKVKKRLSTLSSSLDELENGLAAMLSQSLPELLIGLDTIQQAKLQVIIPYLVYDLVFVYLKTKGLDPKTHPVVAELDRVRQYFDKIKDSEDPAKRQFAIDRAAATRFIKHAIAQAKDAPPTPTPESGPSTRVPLDTEGTADTVPAKVTEKMLERERYQRALREEEREEDSGGGDLEVIDGEEAAEEDDEQQSEDEAVPPAAKGKSRASPETSTGKRRRPPIDPFAVVETGTTPSSSRRQKMARTDIEDGSAGTSSGINTRSRKQSKMKDPH